LEALGAYDSKLPEAKVEGKVNQAVAELYGGIRSAEELKGAYEEIEVSADSIRKDRLKRFLTKVAAHTGWAIRGYDEASKKARMIKRVREAVNPEVERAAVELISNADRYFKMKGAYGQFCTWAQQEGMINKYIEEVSGTVPNAVVEETLIRLGRENTIENKDVINRLLIRLIQRNAGSPVGIPGICGRYNDEDLDFFCEKDFDWVDQGIQTDEITKTENVLQETNEI
jgi:hypothetical protein